MTRITRLASHEAQEAWKDTMIIMLEGEVKALQQEMAQMEQLQRDAVNDARFWQRSCATFAVMFSVASVSLAILWWLK